MVVEPSPELHDIDASGYEGGKAPTYFVFDMLAVIVCVCNFSAHSRSVSDGFKVR